MIIMILEQQEKIIKRYCHRPHSMKFHYYFKSKIYTFLKICFDFAFSFFCLFKLYDLIFELTKINNKHKDIEFVLVNNGSTDSTQTLLEDEASNLGFIKYLNISESKSFFLKLNKLAIYPLSKVSDAVKSLLEFRILELI